jgi:uncharacterized protein
MEPLKALEARLSELYKDASCDHDLGHIRRVIRNARVIGKREGADMSVLLPAAMLHDIALEKGTLHETNDKHAVLGAEKAKSILEGMGFKKVDEICSTIRQHSMDNPTDEPRTLEGDCLFDADKLDAITPTGLVRFMQERALAGNMGPAEVAERFIRVIKVFEFRTKSGRELGKDRKEALDFCDGIIRSSRI